MKVAINGMGIAGPTLAFWLQRYGHEPVLIERAPQLRSGGYTIDFWGIGYDVAEKMGLIPELKQRAYDFCELRFVKSNGHLASRLNIDGFRKIVDGRFFSIERADLSAAIYDSLNGKVETIFGDSIAGIEEHRDGVHVTFEHAAPRDFDLVVGADGLHSRVRDLAFGPIDQFERDLGLRVAAFEIDGYHPHEPLMVVAHSEPGRQAMRVSKKQDRTLFLLSFLNRFETGGFPHGERERQQAVRTAFADFGWEWPRQEEALGSVPDIYYDRVSQIHMPRWTKGRVALIGDAAACVSLLAGEGTGLGMAEAYVLAGELARSQDEYAAGFKAYEDRLRPFIQAKQKSALATAATFVPKTRSGIFFRDLVLRVFPDKWAVRFAAGELTDDIELPEYEDDRIEGSLT